MYVQYIRRTDMTHQQQGWPVVIKALCRFLRLRPHLAALFSFLPASSSTYSTLSFYCSGLIRSNTALLFSWIIIKKKEFEEHSPLLTKMAFGSKKKNAKIAMEAQAKAEEEAKRGNCAPLPFFFWVFLHMLTAFATLF